MASINRQTRSDFQFCMRNANNSQSLGVHTHFCGRCISVGYQSRKIAAGNDSALCLKFLYAHFDGRATVYTQHGRSLGKVSVKIVERTHIT